MDGFNLMVKIYLIKLFIKNIFSAVFFIKKNFFSSILALAASAQGVQNLGNNTPNSGMVQQLFQNQTMQQQQQQQQQMQLQQQHQLQQQLHQQQVYFLQILQSPWSL